jgi:hypothetical protein
VSFKLKITLETFKKLFNELNDAFGGKTYERLHQPDYIAIKCRVKGCPAVFGFKWISDDFLKADKAVPHHSREAHNLA